MLNPDGTTTAWNKDKTKVLHSHGPPGPPRGNTRGTGPGARESAGRAAARRDVSGTAHMTRLARMAAARFRVDVRVFTCPTES